MCSCLQGDREIYDALSKVEVTQLRVLREDLNRKMTRTEEMLDLCVEMLAGGKSLFPAACRGVSTVTPIKPKSH